MITQIYRTVLLLNQDIWNDRYRLARQTLGGNVQVRIKVRVICTCNTEMSKQPVARVTSPGRQDVAANLHAPLQLVLISENPKTTMEN